MNEPITLIISSCGGDVFEMFSVIDYMKMSNIKFNTLVIGKAMSAAAMLLVAGTGKRMATKHSTIMFHEAHGFSYGKISDQKSSIAHEDKLETWTCEILEECSNKPAKWWKDKQKTDYYLTPEKALELGVIDEII